MGILEDLTNQAQLLHIKKQVDEFWKINDDKSGKAVETLSKIHAYLRKLVISLNQLRPEVSQNFVIADTVSIKITQQSDYELSYISKNWNEVVILKFWLRSNDNKIVLHRDDVADFNDLVSNIIANDLIIMQNEQEELDFTTVDEVEILTDIPVTIEFSAIEFSNTTNIIVKNFTHLGSEEYKLDSKLCDNGLLDKIANYILRKSNLFTLSILNMDISENLTPQASFAVVASPEPSQNQSPSKNDILETEKSITLNTKHTGSGIFFRKSKLFITYHENISEINSKGDSFYMGRGENCNITVQSEFASRNHATIVYRKGKFVIIDTSTNGTFIKTQGGKDIYIQQEEYPIAGSGLLSFGKSISPDNEHMIYFFCE